MILLKTKLLITIPLLITAFLFVFLFRTTDVLAVSCQTNTGMRAGDYDNPGLFWQADCNKSCDKHSDCPPGGASDTSGYIASKFQTSGAGVEGGDTTRWCFGGFDGGPKCMKIAVPPRKGTIECDGNPSCEYTGADSRNVAIKTSWEGLKECWDLGGAGTTCNYVGADLCVRISSPAHNYLCDGDNSLCTADRSWKLVAGRGSSPGGRPVFPNGAHGRVPPSGGIGWIRPNMVYEFALFEDNYTATKQRCSSSSDTDCLDYQYKVRACKGLQVATKTVKTTVSNPSGTISCAISGPTSVARGSRATFTATSSDARIRTMEIYYNFNDRSTGGDYHKIATCNTDVTGLSGGCKGEIDTSVIQAEGFTALCNAYAWKPTEDGTSGGNPSTNCVSNNNDPIHCQPRGVVWLADACTGNPLWSTSRHFGWSGCGSNSHKEISLTAPASTPTPEPTSVISCSVSGDIDGNGRIELADFDKWKRAFINGNSITNVPPALNNCANVAVDLVLFNTWRSEFARQ